MATATECGGWALWHPIKGWGHYLSVDTYMEDAVENRKCRVELDGDDRWKVVPVKVLRVDHT